MDDVILNKYAIIDRCLKRVEEEYRGNEYTLSTDFTRQDSIILNFQRACQPTCERPDNSRESVLAIALICSEQSAGVRAK